MWTSIVDDGMDVDSRACGSSSQFTQSQDEFLLQFVGQGVLLSEENNASFANFAMGQYSVLLRMGEAYL